MSFIKKLQTKISKVTEGYYANWTPDMPIEVGDYGDIGGYRLTRDGNISRFVADMKVEMTRTESATLERKDGILISSSGKAGGDAGIGKGKLGLSFGSEGSFLYHLKDITNNQFKERREIFEKIAPLILSDKISWKDDYVLVTEVKQAGKALILVSDSANASMEVEYSSENGAPVNFVSAEGDVNFSMASDRVVKYEIKQLTPLLFRVIGFVDVPPGGGPAGPLSQIKKKLHSWFGDDLPEPEQINLRDYIENEDSVDGIFEFPNGETITLRQEFVDIESFIQKSEKVSESDEVEIERVEIGKHQMYG